MAIWQFRIILIPGKILLSRYDVLPPAIPMKLAEDFAWWSHSQPPARFEEQLDLILPRITPWSECRRMWGQKHSDDAYVVYTDENKTAVQEIAFHVDARAISADLVGRICAFARQLGCVLMTAEYEILLPDESMVLTAVNHSTAKKFVDDPVSTLQGLDQAKMQEAVNHLTKGMKKNPPLKE